jgi:hypothetical protein
MHGEEIFEAILESSRFAKLGTKSTRHDRLRKRGIIVSGRRAVERLEFQILVMTS